MTSAIVNYYFKIISFIRCFSLICRRNKDDGRLKASKINHIHIMKIEKEIDVILQRRSRKAHNESLST